MSMPASETRSLHTSAVMPRPIAAGVFGIARMTGVDDPSAASKRSSVVPAATDRNRVSLRPPNCRTDSNAGSIIWGLTATTTTAGEAGRSAFRFTPTSALSSSEGAGSTTHTALVSMPLPIHP